MPYIYTKAGFISSDGTKKFRQGSVRVPSVPSVPSGFVRMNKNKKGDAELNIEIIEFFPIEKDDIKRTLSGTMRISLPSIGIHILGIYVEKKKDFYFFHMPARHTQDENGERVRYPIVVFEDSEQQRALVDAIRQKGREYIEKRLADPENTLVFPKKEQNPQGAIKPKSAYDRSKEVKPNPPSSFAEKTWITPKPLPKKPTFQRNGNYGR